MTCHEDRESAAGPETTKSTSKSTLSVYVLENIHKSLQSTHIRAYWSENLRKFSEEITQCRKRSQKTPIYYILPQSVNGKKHRRTVWKDSVGTSTFTGEKLPECSIALKLVME